MRTIPGLSKWHQEKRDKAEALKQARREKIIAELQQRSLKPLELAEIAGVKVYRRPCGSYNFAPEFHKLIDEMLSDGVMRRVKRGVYGLPKVPRQTSREKRMVEMWHCFSFAETGYAPAISYRTRCWPAP